MRACFLAGRRVIAGLRAFFGLVIVPLTAIAGASDVLECPPVMAHAPLAQRHPGWIVYSHDPLRLTGADIEYVVDSHLEATLDPDRVQTANDDHLSTTSVFDLTRHRGARPFSFVCHYGVHAQLRRRIPPALRECTVTHRGRFGPDEGEVSASCR